MRWGECSCGMRRRASEKEKVALEWYYYSNTNTTFRTMLARLVTEKNELEVGGLKTWEHP